jgi:hypothetical protein
MRFFCFDLGIFVYNSVNQNAYIVRAYFLDKSVAVLLHYCPIHFKIQNPFECLSF